jgi:hypothetical protein
MIIPNWMEKTCSNPPTSLLSNVFRRKRTKKNMDTIVARSLKWSTDVSPGLRMTIEEVFVGLPFRCQSKNLYVLGSRPSMGPKNFLARFVWQMFCPCRVSPCSPDGCLRRYVSPFPSQSDLVKLTFCKTWDAIFERLNITKLHGFQKWTPNWGWQITCFPSCFLQSKGQKSETTEYRHLDAKHEHIFYVYHLGI